VTPPARPSRRTMGANRKPAVEEQAA
jgi:hypothetical protein